MAQVTLGCGQQSISRLKYAPLSCFVTLKAFEKGLLNVLTSAVGFMEGYDSEGLTSLLGLPNDGTPRTLAFVPYRMGTEKENNASYLLSVKPPDIQSSKKPNSFAVSHATRVPDTKIQFPSSCMVSSDCSYNIGNFSNGFFVKEELAYGVLNSTNSYHVALRVITLLLASGVHVPRKIILDLCDRLAVEDPEAAWEIASLLEAELSLSEYMFSLCRNLSGRRRPSFTVVQRNFCNVSLDKRTEQSVHQKESKNSRLSRLQSVRLKRG
ncbi:peptidyl-prolyl cis-trans isomerase [Trypanosoma cruzi marinkellei]|uniref:Peptidyl-prolyl cis-trans isomerase n=1 Tax=Trypanosoma cruzi marinkellei TaxID=85056 RepID=K2N6E7_TRYCR|nr:peptidyl-prolyl cis-trans isomerase [Trypanosoma cruzi marinkellei]